MHVVVSGLGLLLSKLNHEVGAFNAFRNNKNAGVMGWLVNAEFDETPKISEN